MLKAQERAQRPGEKQVLKKLIYLAAPIRAKDSFKFLPILLFFLVLFLGLLIFCAFFTYPQKVNGLGLLLLQGDLKQVLSPISGTMETWFKEEGDSIKKGDALAVIRSVHNDQDFTKQVDSRVDGIIAEVIAYPNTSVKKGQAMAIVTNHGDVRKDLELVGFVSSLQGKSIKPGMKAFIDPSITKPYIHGHLVAFVKRVGKLPMTQAALQSAIKIPEIATYIRNKIDAEPFIVVLTLESNDRHKTGYLWSGPGPSFALDSGILADISIIVEEPTILSLLLPSLFHGIEKER